MHHLINDFRPHQVRKVEPLNIGTNYFVIHYREVVLFLEVNITECSF